MKTNPELNDRGPATTETVNTVPQDRSGLGNISGTGTELQGSTGTLTTGGGDVVGSSVGVTGTTNRQR
jgi:hypothetical protein